MVVPIMLEMPQLMGTEGRGVRSRSLSLLPALKHSGHVRHVGGGGELMLGAGWWSTLTHLACTSCTPFGSPMRARRVCNPYRLKEQGQSVMIGVAGCGHFPITMWPDGPC